MNRRNLFSSLFLATITLISGCAENNTRHTRPILYYFGAKWCKPCREMKKLFKDEDVKSELAKYDIRMFNYDEPKDKPWFDSYDVESFPTSIFILNGKIVERRVGGMSKANLLSVLRKYN